MLKQVLLTGASGFLGNYINNYFSSTVNVFTLGRLNCFINCDLSHSIPLLPDVNIVIHAAGKAHSVPKTSKDKLAFFDVNFKGTQNLLQGLEKCKSLPKEFIFISSVAVYGIENGINISEDAPLLAQDSYGLSKIHAEQLVLDWCKKYNVICTILRLPLLAGQNPPGNLGAMIKGIQKGYYFNIAGGRAKKSMVLADDVAQFIPIIAPVGGIYNLTDGEHPSFEALSHAIAKKKVINLPSFVAKAMGFIGDIVGERAPINSLKFKKITSDLTFNDSKARKLGWEPRSVLKYLKTNDL